MTEDTVTEDTGLSRRVIVYGPLIHQRCISSLSHLPPAPRPTSLATLFSIKKVGAAQAVLCTPYSCFENEKVLAT